MERSFPSLSKVAPARSELPSKLKRILAQPSVCSRPAQAPAAWYPRRQPLRPSCVLLLGAVSGCQRASACSWTPARHLRRPWCRTLRLDPPLSCLVAASIECRPGHGYDAAAEAFPGSRQRKVELYWDRRKGWWWGLRQRNRSRPRTGESGCAGDRMECSGWCTWSRCRRCRHRCSCWGEGPGPGPGNCVCAGGGGRRRRARRGRDDARL